jgi:pimeloyl-ACP methyl ester carboxylesterase
VVFANDSGNSVCDWIPLARQLASSGHRVAVFTYSDTSAAGEPSALRATLAVAAAAAATGGRYALVGASLGGRIVIEAAAKHPPGLTAIVSLSGEATVYDYPDILPDARRVTTPALYIGARDDSLTDGVHQQLALHQAMRGNPNELIQVDGVAHSTELVNNYPTVTSWITGFLDDENPPVSTGQRPS